MHVYPNKEILNDFGYSIEEKPRTCVIASRTFSNLNLNSNLFNDNIDFLIYSVEPYQVDYPNIYSQEFSLSFVINHIKLVKSYEKLTTLVLVGPILFNFIISTNDIPDYFLLTELDSEEPTQHEVGEIDLEKVTQLYQLEFTSQDFVNNFGVWRLKVYKKIIL